MNDPGSVSLTVHESQWPETLARQLHAALLQRRIPPKFHYESARQGRAWLRVHESLSPARTDPQCQAAYEQGLAAAADLLGAGEVEVLALGCGGGQKEVALVEHLQHRGATVQLTACDVSTGLVITTLQRAMRVLPADRGRGLVCDLTCAEGLSGFLGGHGARRLVTFFGLVPNFEPEETTAVLRSILRAGDRLLCSANLAPGDDYPAGVRAILPQYDNEPTRRWLSLLLEDLGLESADGTLRFTVEPAQRRPDLLRIAARFELHRAATAWVERQPVALRQGETVALFFSYRHTPATVTSLLGGLALRLRGQWLSQDASEGVFLLD